MLTYLASNLDNQFLVAYFYDFWFQFIFALTIVSVLLHYVTVIIKKLFFPSGI